MKLLIKQQLIIVLFLFTSLINAQTPISEFLFGQNAWMPDYIGDTRFYGKLEELWDVSEACNLDMVRIGGIAYDNRQITDTQIITLINSIHDIGAVPLIQVSWNNGAFSAAQAAAMVNYVNNVQNRNVKYWSISNEPVYSHSANSTTISTYFKEFATAMKAQDPTIKIVGPDLAWYNTTVFTNLLGGVDDITGTDINGNYYIDVVSYHVYTFSGNQIRSQVVEVAQTQVEPNIQLLKEKINTVNQSRTDENSLQWGVTEFNINTQNSATNDIAGVGVNSFINGQLWAEMFGLGMKYAATFINPWSIHENAGSGGGTDFGYIGGNDPYTVRPNYYHEQLLASNTKTYYANYTSNITNVKTFGSYDDTSITVMILNMDQTGYSYEVFNNSSSDSAQPLLINTPDLSVDNSHIGYVEPESTQLLIFNQLGEIQEILCYSLTDAINSLAPSSCLTLGVSDEISNNEIILYPNPASNKIILESFLDLNEFRIYSILGKDVTNLVTKEKMNNTFDLSKLSSGIYFIKTDSSTHKIIKK